MGEEWREEEGRGGEGRDVAGGSGREFEEIQADTGLLTQHRVLEHSANTVF